jgi:acyl carrier protein
MPSGYDAIELFLRNEVAAITGKPAESIGADTVLVGGGRVIDSADLVMLLLAVEDYAREELGTHFDWTSDSAMSEARSVLRSVGTLAKHLSTLSPAA